MQTLIHSYVSVRLSKNFVSRSETLSLAWRKLAGFNTLWVMTELGVPYFNQMVFIRMALDLEMRQYAHSVRLQMLSRAFLKSFSFLSYFFFNHNFSRGFRIFGFLPSLIFSLIKLVTLYCGLIGDCWSFSLGVALNLIDLTRN